MKILIIENGIHLAGAIDFNFGQILNRYLRRRGIESLVWGKYYKTFDKAFSTVEQNCDVIIILDFDLHGISYEQIHNSKKLKIYWDKSSFLNHSRIIDSACKMRINLFLANDERILPELTNVFDKVQFIPRAIADDIFKPDKNAKMYDIGFCGTRKDREQELSLLGKFKIELNLNRYGYDMVRSINSFKIHFNKARYDKLNMRIFETTGCRTLLLTNNINSLDKYFKPDEEIVIYNSKEELLDKTKYLIANERELFRIADNGYKRVLRDHSFLSSVERLVEIINDFPKVESATDKSKLNVNTQMMRIKYFHEYIAADKYDLTLLKKFYSGQSEAPKYFRLRVKIIFIIKCLLGWLRMAYNTF